MKNKMSLLWTCFGAAGGTAEIIAPKIERTCSKCGENMNLIDGRGFINSGTHTFVAKCPKCGTLEKFNDLNLWRKLWGKAVKDKAKQTKKQKEQVLKECNKLIEQKAREFQLSPFTKRLLKDGLIFNADINAILDTLSTKTIKEFEEFNFKDIKYIFMGNSKINDSGMFFEFIENENENILFNSTEFYDEKTGKTVKKNVDIALMRKQINFAQELMKLIYLLGGVFQKGEIKDGYYILAKMQDDVKYTIKYNSNNLLYYTQVYFYYHLHTFDKNIVIKDGKYKKKLNELTNKFDRSKALFYHLMHFFNDFDFIYSILAHLKTKKDLDNFLLMLEKDEGIMSHERMNIVSRYASEAFYLYDKPYKNYGNKPVFIKDIVQEYMKDETSKRLHVMLYKILKMRRSAENIVIMLKTKQNKEEMIKFLETGETNIDKIHHKLLSIIR